MKTKEFIRRVEDELGYVTGKSENYINIRKEGGKFGKLFAMVAFNEVLSIDTSLHNFTSLEKHDKDLLFDLMLEYARTPLEEREEEKKYYVKLKNEVLAYNMRGSYLNFSKGNEHYFFSNQELTRYYISQFTQKQIEEMPDEVKEILPLCKQVEVTP